MSALSSMGNKGTLDDVTKHIAQSIDKPDEYVRTEVKNVLNRGVDDGFLTKRDKYYVLTARDDFQVDFKLNLAQSDPESERKSGQIDF